MVSKIDILLLLLSLAFLALIMLLFKNNFSIGRRKSGILSDISKFDIIKATQDLIHNNLGNNEDLPFMIQEIIREGNWRYRENTKREIRQFFSFKDFIEGSLPFGLLMKWETIESLAREYPSLQADMANVLINPKFSKRADNFSTQIEKPGKEIKEINLGEHPKKKN